MESVRCCAARAGVCACAVNNAVQTRLSRLFFPFNDLEIPRKLRKQAWAYRITYVLWTIAQTLLLFYMDDSYLWKDGGVNPHAAWTFLLMLCVTWLFYFQVQGSNPGYITATMLYRFHTVHDTFGVGDNGEGDSFTGAVFRRLTNLGRRAATNVRAVVEATDDGDRTNQQRTNSDNDDNTSSSGEEDDEDDDDDEDAGPEGVSAEPKTKGDASGPTDVRITIAPAPESETPLEAGSDSGSPEERPEFIASRRYTGARPGYYYANGNQGQGYYIDTGEEKEPEPEEPSAKAQQAESMSRVERFLAGQDKGSAQRFWVPKHDPRKYEQSKFVDDEGQIGLEKADDGSFQTRMDFEDVVDDFPLRARYCKQADRVVPKFDHYCDMLGTPIGERNHALFWMFLVAQSLLLVWAFSIVASEFPSLFNMAWNVFEQNGGSLILPVTNLVLISVELLGVLGLLGFHTWAALTDTLTYEFLKNNDLEYLKHFGPCDLPFSKGPIRNFYRFFVVQPGWCTATEEWLPTKYAPPEQFFRNSRNVCANPWENKYWRCC